MMFSVRNTNDPACGKGVNTHHNVWVSDTGMAVNFFSKEEILSLTDGFELIDIKEFEEGQKRLFGIILRKP